MFSNLTRRSLTTGGTSKREKPWIQWRIVGPRPRWSLPLIRWSRVFFDTIWYHGIKLVFWSRWSLPLIRWSGLRSCSPLIWASGIRWCSQIRRTHLFLVKDLEKQVFSWTIGNYLQKTFKMMFIWQSIASSAKVLFDMSRLSKTIEIIKAKTLEHF